MNAVVRAVAEGLYRGRVREELRRLPWLLVDEAHAFFDGVAGPGLERLLTRGRAPGVSLVAATQRPSALPAVAVSQSDLLFAHRLTSGADIEALERARPTYLRGLGERLPTGTGEALVVDDRTETAHTVRVRERRTPHEGDSPSASALAARE
jgi:DNA helicase HerA-like ATPase